ncbi:MAG TPA: metallophosphoesterase [Firmicutes bacterium]|nr:metallophosphoesterase [Bacillota bacterium]
MKSLDSLSVLMLGDVVGRVGRKSLARALPLLKDRYDPDVVIVNCENATHGRGCSHEHYLELLKAGADILTSGNHFYDSKDVFRDYDWSKLVRPINLGPEAPLAGARTFTIKGKTLTVINAIGCAEMQGYYERPLVAIDRVLKGDSSAFRIVDFHAEATGEKICSARYLDGRISLFVGTHTHVQTNDERILPQGTGYISDLGMCGLDESCLGASPERAVAKVVNLVPLPQEYPDNGRGRVEGVFAVLRPGYRCESIIKVRAFAEV